MSIHTWRVADRRATPVRFLLVAFEALTNARRNALAVLAALTNRLALKVGNSTETVEALALVGRHALRVNALEAIGGEGANRLAVRRVQPFVVCFAHAEIRSETRHGTPAFGIALRSTPEVIGLDIPHIAPALVIADAVRVYAVVAAHWNAFVARCLKTLTALADRFVYFIMLER